MSEQTGTVFVVGATGMIGAQLLPRLQKAKVPIRALCRKTSKVEEFKKNGIDAVHADLTHDVESLAKCMKGCQTLFLISPAIPEQLEQNKRAFDAAILAGCSWIVRISAADAREEGNTPWVKAHAAADRILKAKAAEKGTKWTIISPSAFMGNLLSEAGPISKGFLPQSCGEGKACWIDTEDVAATSAQVLIDGPQKHHGQDYILTGPEELSMSQIAQRISKGVGHKVRYIDLPGPVFKQLLKLGGMDDWMANGLVAQFNEIIRPGKEDVELNDVVQKITGNPATSFEKFARDNIDSFKGRDILPLLTTGGVLMSVAVGVLVAYFR